MIRQKARAAAVKEPASDVMVQLDDVCMRYGQKIVLENCDLECRRGHVTAVIGPSGAGKSTILRLISGLRQPDAGRVSVDNVDITDMPDRDLIELRKRMGFAFQFAALFDSLTVGENVAYPLYEHTTLSGPEIARKVSETLDSLGLDDVEDKLPGELSGGMQKRVGFARAIVNDPDILLFDEPTTGLDPIMTHVITNTILDIQNRLRATSIVVTHDLPFVFTVADYVALLFEGSIIEAGTPREIRQSPNPLAQQFLQGSALGPMPL